MARGQITIPALDDDKLFTPEVGDWAEEKYKLVKLYGSLFTTSMRKKWGRLAYVDLFSGAGRAKIRGTSRIVPASPTLALTLDHRFDRYVFCERNPTRMEALRARVERDFPEVDVRFVEGDANQERERVLAELPMPSPGRSVLAFCFADPFALKNLQFETVKTLATRLIDFLILVPTGFDAVRNEQLYLPSENQTVDRFLGNLDWRKEWAAAKSRGVSFDRFMTDSFGRSMERLGYTYEGIDWTHLVRNTLKRARLYRLVLFSRNPLGTKFWKAVQPYADPQGRLFD